MKYLTLESEISLLYLRMQKFLKRYKEICFKQINTITNNVFCEISNFVFC